MNEDRIKQLKSALMAIRNAIKEGFLKFEDVEDSIKEMIEEVKQLELKK